MFWQLAILIVCLILFSGFCAFVEYANRKIIKKEFVFTNSGYEKRIKDLESQIKELV